MEEAELEKLIDGGLAAFYRRRSATLAALTLSKCLRRKNPYILRALALEDASELIERVLYHQLIASDETIFGDAFFEPIAKIASGGVVSPAKGVDFAVETDTRYSVYAMKSGPNVFNSSQKARQNDEFNEIRSRLFKIQKQYDPVLAHAYGRYNTSPSKIKVYRDVSGQAFWEEITGDPDFYLQLIRLMRDAPRKHRDEFEESWSATVNRLTADFFANFCFEDGRINWDAVTAYISSKGSPAKLKKAKPATY
jgi:hypothetical protein